ncbi:MAG: hypothetical protein EBR28_01810 [Planctomycetia bacterium]|nr:hypothetical protein [Planctomycetia bacterium]
MATAEHETGRRAGRWRRWLLGLGLGASLLWAASSGWQAWSAYSGYLAYEPQDGDVIFQSLPHGPIVWAIEGVTRSPYSHCGIVAKRDGEWIVYEAYRGVSATPLKTFLFRGRGGGFAVYRLRDEHRRHVPETLRCCETYLGRPYDIRYRLDDEKIYCSELIYKAYRDATHGERLGDLSRFGDMNWQPYEMLIRQVEGGDVPVDREMITPAGLARARQLELVLAHNLAVEAPAGSSR